MKSFIKSLTALFTAVFVLCFSVVPVSAAVSFPEFQNNSTNVTEFNLVYSQYFSSHSNVPSNSVLCYQYSSDGYYSIYVIPYGNTITSFTYTDPDTAITYDMYVAQNVRRKRSQTPIIDIIDTVSNATNFTPSSSVTTQYTTYGYVIAYNRKDNFYFICEYDWNRKSPNQKMTLKNIPDVQYSCIAHDYTPYFGPVQPDPVVKPSLYGIRLGIEKKGFVDWLKSEGKESVINSPGFSFTSSQIETLVDVYDSYGNNPFAFFSSLSKTFNITTDLKAASSLVQTIQQLYHDYQSYKNSVDIEEIKPSSATHPHWRTDKEDVSLVTDQPDDTRDISILREILRTLIDMPYAVSVRLNYLQTGLTDILLDFQNQIYMLDSLPDETALAVSNNLISPINETRDSVNSLLGPLNDINNSINNLDFDTGSGDSSGPLDIKLDVNITEQKQKEIDDFFVGWNQRYSETLNSKVPVVSQLSGIFNSEFFEKCGIDTNSDGEVYQYYYPELSSASVSYYSSGTVSADQKLVSDFLLNFDSADINYLDDVRYSEDVPDFSVSIKGEKHSIFNFKLYAKYRTQIHTIIIFFVYSLYFLSLYKSLPQIIGNVSDVRNAFSDRGDS